MIRRLALVTLLATGAVLGCSAPAFADVTAFVGTYTNPERQTLRGLSAGFSLLIVGFEGELAQAGEDESAGSPSLLTLSGNAFLQTPVPILGTRFYLTTGAGIYREQVDAIDHQETHVVFNTGGGAKITLIGPLRVRLDYRVLKLRGDSLRPSTAHRLYAGVNLGF